MPVDAKDVIEGVSVSAMVFAPDVKVVDAGTEMATV
jgi:hypothetical protein